MKESAQFEKWFNSTFLFSCNFASEILNSESKSTRLKQLRLCEVCKRLLDNPKKPVQELREEIALDFFVTLRIALDYINYSRLILRKWKKAK